MLSRFFPRAPAVLACFCSASSFAAAQSPGWSTNFDVPGTGSGLNGIVMDMAVYYDTLVAGGDFTSCGTPVQAINRIASFDGSAWTPLGTTAGANSRVNALKEYTLMLSTDVITTAGPAELYAAGRFTSIDGTLANRVAVWDSTAWTALVSSGSSIDGTSGEVQALEIYNDGTGPRLIVGGQFATAGGVSVNNLASWKTGTWSAFQVGSSTPGTAGGTLSVAGRVDALRAYGTDLYVGGYFSTVYGASGSQLVNRIVKWSGATQTWVALGSGIVGGNVNDIEVFDDDGPTGPNPTEIYVAGNFQSAGGVTAAHVAKWNPTSLTWSAVGSGFSSQVYDLAIHRSDCGPRLIASGGFFTSGANSTSRIAQWDGVNWQPITTGITGSAARCGIDYQTLPYGYELFVGGLFTQAGGLPSSNIAAASLCPSAIFPVIDGEVAVTGMGTVDSDFVLSLVNVNPVRGPKYGALGPDWLAPKFHNEFAPTSAAEIWNRANLGQVFGVCYDDLVPPNIYVAASTSYSLDVPGPAGWGAVYKIDGVTGDISPFTTTSAFPTLPTLHLNTDIPNTGCGLGDICFNRTYRVFYVSNFEDGRIYVLDMNGVVIQAWSPFGVNDTTPGFVPLSSGSRVWALNVVEPRALLFSVWLRDSARMNTPLPSAWPASAFSLTPNNAIFRAQIGAFGLLSGTPSLRAWAPKLSSSSTFSFPISDLIESPDVVPFTGGSRLRCAERCMSNDTTPTAHAARVFDFLGPVWGPAAPTTIWPIGGALNAAGGADFTCTWDLVATGDALAWTPGGIYGLQIIPFFGLTTVANSWLIDLNGIYGGQDKTEIGDVETYRNCYVVPWVRQSDNYTGM